MTQDEQQSAEDSLGGMSPLNISRDLSPRRRQLVDWFRQNAAPLAGAYEGALRLLDDRSFPGRLHFIAHAVRDIADRLVFVLDPQQKAHRVDYEGSLDEIEKKWPQIKTGQGPDGTPEVGNKVFIGYRVALLADNLVNAHRARRQRPSNYVLLFRFLMRNELCQAEVNHRLVEDFKNMRKWFMELTHLRSRMVPMVEEPELQSQFSSFEKMLHSFVGDFFVGVAELDEILQQANQ